MAAAQTSNGYDPARVKQCVERIESLDQERERAHMTYMGECQGINERKKDVLDEAKNAWGIPKRALKTVVKARATERKLEALREDLEQDDQDAYDQIRHALGDLADTPLGRKALGDDEQDLRSQEQRDREELREDIDKKKRQRRTAALDDVAIANGEKLAAGIQPLNS